MTRDNCVTETIPAKESFGGEAYETNKLVYKGAKFKIHQQNNDQTLGHIYYIIIYIYIWSYTYLNIHMY